MSINFMLIGLIGSYIIHGITFISSLFTNRLPIVDAVNTIENDVVNIATDVKEIIHNPSLDTINKDVKDITNNLCEIVKEANILEEIIINSTNDSTDI